MFYLINLLIAVHLSFLQPNIHAIRLQLMQICTSLKATKFYTNSENNSALKRLPCINYNLTERDHYHHYSGIIYLTEITHIHLTSLNAETVKYCSFNTKSYWWIL